MGRSASSENRRHKDFQSFSATADTAPIIKQKTPAFLPGNLWCGAVRLVGEPPTQGFSVLFRHGGYRIRFQTKNPGISARESVVWGGPPRRRTADTRIFSPFPPRRIPHRILKQKTPALLPGNLWCGAVRLVGEPPTQGFSVLFRHGGYRTEFKTKNPGVTARESVVWGGPPRRRTADTRIFSPFPPRRIPHQISNKKPRHFCQGICGVGRSARRRTADTRIFSPFPPRRIPHQISNKKPRHFCQGISGVGRDRTADTRIFSPLLYRLSYRTKFPVLFRHGGYRTKFPVLFRHGGYRTEFPVLFRHGGYRTGFFYSGPRK